MQYILTKLKIKHGKTKKAVYTANSQLPLFDKIRAWKEECFENERIDLKSVAVFEYLTGETG